MRLRGPPSITQANLSTAVSSQDGTVPAQGDVVLILNAYTFTFNSAAIIGPKALDWNIEELPVPVVLDPDEPHWLMINRHTASRSYAAIWRHINP